MRYVRTDSFKADYRRLGAAERELFRQAAREFDRGCDVFARTRDPSVWPASLRVTTVRGAAGVWEMTWSFSGPDGRATWEWTNVAGDGVVEPVVRWRRTGDHRIRQPDPQSTVSAAGPLAEPGSAHPDHA